MSDARNLTSTGPQRAAPPAQEEDRRPTLISTYVESALGIHQVGAGLSVANGHLSDGNELHKTTNEHLAAGNDLHKVTNATLVDGNELHKTTNEHLAASNDLHKATNATLVDGNELHKTTNEHLAASNDLHKATNATLVDGNELHKTTNAHLAAGNVLHETANIALLRANDLRSEANSYAHRTAVVLEQIHAVFQKWYPPFDSMRSDVDELRRRHQAIADQVELLQNRQAGDEVVGGSIAMVTQDQMSELRAMFSELQDQVTQLRDHRPPENPGGGQRSQSALQQRRR